MKTNENQTVSKICKNCEASTIECTTGKTYCCDVSWLRMQLAGRVWFCPRIHAADAF